MRKADEMRAVENEPQTEYSQSAQFVGLLSRLGCAIAMSSYQSSFLYHLGCDPRGGLHVHQSVMPAPMGLCYEGSGKLTLAARDQIIRFENVLASNQKINDAFDTCFFPRRIHLTGRLDAHDVGVDAHGQVVFVNTRYNCLATLSDRHSFTPYWRPNFIDAIVDEDRCHLNGMAMRDGVPAFATAVSRSNTVDGWRDRRDDGGVVIDITENRIVCEGLSMPHSPRWYQGELWVLNAGTGELGVVAGLGRGMGHFEPRILCPGFLRGLAFHQGYAFVGLSKPRYKRFEGLALEARLKAADAEPWCGLQIIDLARGHCAEWFRIDGQISELYDVAVLPGMATPMALSPYTPETSQLITWDPELKMAPDLN